MLELGADSVCPRSRLTRTSPATKIAWGVQPPNLSPGVPSVVGKAAYSASSLADRRASDRC